MCFKINVKFRHSCWPPSGNTAPAILNLDLKGVTSTSFNIRTLYSQGKNHLPSWDSKFSEPVWIMRREIRFRRAFNPDFHILHFIVRSLYLLSYPTNLLQGHFTYFFFLLQPKEASRDTQIKAYRLTIKLYAW